MASNGLNEPSVPPEDQTGDGTLLIDAPSPEARVPSEPNNGKDTLETTTGKCAFYFPM